MHWNRAHTFNQQFRSAAVCSVCSVSSVLHCGPSGPYINLNSLTITLLRKTHSTLNLLLEGMQAIRYIRYKVLFSLLKSMYLCTISYPALLSVQYVRTLFPFGANHVAFLHTTHHHAHNAQLTQNTHHHTMPKHKTTMSLRPPTYSHKLLFFYTIIISISTASDCASIYARRSSEFVAVNE